MPKLLQNGQWKLDVVIDLIKSLDYKIKPHDLNALIMKEADTTDRGARGLLYRANNILKHSRIRKIRQIKVKPVVKPIEVVKEYVAVTDYPRPVILLSNTLELSFEAYLNECDDKVKDIESTMRDYGSASLIDSSLRRQLSRKLKMLNRLKKSINRLKGHSLETINRFNKPIGYTSYYVVANGHNKGPFTDLVTAARVMERLKTTNLKETENGHE